MQDIRFGFQAAAADVAGVPDDQLYRDLIADCALGHKLGYDAAWLLEHHFSDYYPTPSPLVMMAYIAAKFPDLSLGTSVLVLPWYHPLRLAEEIAMLNMLTQGTLHLGIGRGKILERWRGKAGAKATGAILPISVKMFIADTDEEARELGRRYYPPYFALQADHYEADANPWVGISEYADFSRMFANLRKLTDPAELGPFLDSNLVGSPATICKRIDALVSLGFNYFMVSSATPGTPLAIRQKMMRRFAEEICPRYSSAMRKGRAA